MKYERNDSPSAVRLSWNIGQTNTSVYVNEHGTMGITVHSASIMIIEIPDIPIEEIICMLLDAKKLVSEKQVIDALRGKKNTDDVPF